MNLYGTIDLGAYFAAEVRVIDGEECLCLPLTYNPTIRFFGGHPTAMVTVREMKTPDDEGFTHVCYPYIPKSVRATLQEADYIKMTSPVGRFRVLDPPATREEPPQPPASLGHEILAHNPVRDKDIPV